MASAVPAKPDYGLDDPLIVHRWFGRAVWAIVIAVGVWFINHNEYPGPSARILGTLTALALVFCAVAWFKIHSSREGKLKVRDQLLDSLALKGNEKILDVGCGRGLLAIGAAKRLQSGKVIGIDVWNPQDLSGNSAEAARDNAKNEGVADRVRFETSDARQVHYPDNHFDSVVSSRAIHGLADDHEREKAIREMYRVLKPGGRLAIFDSVETGFYADVLRKIGAQDITLSGWSFLWCVLSRSVTAHKP